MTEAEWLAEDRIEHLLHGLKEMKFSSERVRHYVATFAESGRVRKLLSPKMQIVFDDYVRWAQEGGPNPATAHPELSDFDPLEKQLIDACSIEDDLKYLMRSPRSPWGWWAAGSFALCEAYNRSVVGQWRRTPNADTVELLQRAVDRLRDVIGNPFRPTHFAPEWRTDTAVAVARQMYAARDFSAMPILADALEDAGCDNDDILTHCRAPQQTHTRGCWVVDLVSGKE